MYAILMLLFVLLYFHLFLNDFNIWHATLSTAFNYNCVLGSWSSKEGVKTSIKRRNVMLYNKI